MLKTFQRLTQLSHASKLFTHSTSQALTSADCLVLNAHFNPCCDSDGENT